MPTSLWAEQTFGRAHIERALYFRQRRQRKYGGTTNDGTVVNEVQSDSLRKHRTDSYDAHEKLGAHDKIVLALKQMGFHRAQARRAVRAVEKRQRGEGPQTLEALVREAVLEATRAA